jgi:SAM-dependent methyltransferase
VEKIYQKGWFGITFRSFTAPDLQKPADASFYERFYEKFFEKFSSYDDLPKEWQARKRQIVELILQRTKSNEKLLSIGCGIGYIESLLGKAGRQVTAIEPSETALLFLKKYSNVRVLCGLFPQALAEDSNVAHDMGYMVAVDYVFDEEELISVLRGGRDIGLKRVLMVSVSITDPNRFRRMSKSVGKRLLSYARLYDRGQLWGYARSPGEFITSFERAGFVVKEYGFLGEDTFFIEGSPEGPADPACILE